MYSEKFKTFIDIWRNDFGIERSIDEKLCLDANGNPLPWYTYPAIEYLKQFDYIDKKIFEFGCGYSSAFWSERAAKVISVEDNQEWHAKWSAEFKFSNWQLILCPENANYDKTILQQSDTFDVIIIDGKLRAECAASAIKKLTSDGMIILDDSDRINTSQEYIDTVQTLKSADLLQIDFYGFCPLNNYPKTTSLFLRRDFAFKTLSPIQPSNGWGNLWSKSRKVRKEFYRHNK